MGRILGFPTATPTENDYFLMDSVDGGTRAVSAKQLADALFAIASQVSGSGGTPVGEIISYMGITAPVGYLICDGAEYEIAEYPYLTQHFVGHFGRVNYFGGDGETTFAVPDLRGEFLRGAGTNSHTNQGNGDNVGKHQNATTHQNTTAYAGSIYLFTDTNSSTATNINHPAGEHPDYMLGTRKYQTLVKGSTSSSEIATMPTTFTSRPTNTSVLYCIKYQ